MSWRLAESLTVLRDEVNTVAPDRSRRSDGTIGDAAHAAHASDHNPNSAGVVCALDLTHDPDNGANMHAIAEHIRRRGHPALKYLIWNRRIYSVARSAEGWRSYSGSNPHTSHLHISVGVGPDGRSTGPYDNTSPWGISSAAGAGREDPLIGLKKGDRGERVTALQALITYAGGSLPRFGVDGHWGDETSAGLLAVRKGVGSTVTSADSITGYAYAQIMRAVARREAQRS